MRQMEVLLFPALALGAFACASALEPIEVFPALTSGKPDAPSVR